MLALLAFAKEMGNADNPEERIVIMSKALEGQKRNLRERIASWSGPHAHRGEQIWYDEQHGAAVTRDPHKDIRRKHRYLVRAMQAVGARMGMVRKNVKIEPMTPRTAKPVEPVEEVVEISAFIPVEEKPSYFR